MGAAFSAATDAARLRMPLGGDLIDPGISAAEALEAARPLLAAKAPKALYDVKALGALLPETAGDAFDAMLAAYVLDPQRPSYDLQALCESAGTPWDAACPAASLWPLRAWQEEKLASDEPVSYTHLDVYKRQHQVDADVCKPRRPRHAHGLHGLPRRCLLYTSQRNAGDKAPQKRGQQDAAFTA